jgi:hypothetical protein
MDEPRVIATMKYSERYPGYPVPLTPDELKIEWTVILDRRRRVQQDEETIRRDFAEWRAARVEA